MPESKAKEVAKLFGLELEEEFAIKGLLHKYKFTEDVLMCFLNWGTEWIPEDSNSLITGKCTIIKHKPILTDIEKEYLSNIIKPFRDSVVSISKCNCYGGCAYFIQIKVIQNKRKINDLNILIYHILKREECIEV